MASGSAAVVTKNGFHKTPRPNGINSPNPGGIPKTHTNGLGLDGERVSFKLRLTHFRNVYKVNPDASYFGSFFDKIGDFE